MPTASLLGPLIGAGSSFLGQQANAQSQQQQNAIDQQYSTQMYERQKADSIEFWNMQNQYNDPQAQMARLQNAGLNPNLVYGNGGGSQTAGPVSTPDFHQVSRRPPEWGNAVQSAGLGFLNSLYDLDIKQAQVDNLKAQNTVIQQDAILKGSLINATDMRFSKDKFQLELDQMFGGDAYAELVRQRRVTTDNSLDENARRAALTSSSLRESAERLLNMKESRIHSATDRARLRSQIDIMSKEGALKDLEIQLRKIGLSPNDPWWSRIVARVIGETEAGSAIKFGKPYNMWEKKK